MLTFLTVLRLQPIETDLLITMTLGPVSHSTHYYIHSLTHTHTHIHTYTTLILRLRTYMLSLTHLLTHSLTYSLTYSLAHSLTHSLTPLYVCVLCQDLDSGVPASMSPSLALHPESLFAGSLAFTTAGALSHTSDTLSSSKVDQNSSSHVDSSASSSVSECETNEEAERTYSALLRSIEVIDWSLFG